MKLFLDTAHLDSIKQHKKSGLVDGITTNPTNVSQESGDIKSLLVSICSLMDPYEVSIEITEQEPQKVYEQAKKIAQLAPNVVVKIPCYTPYVPLIKQLVQEGIKINITLVFTAVQGLMMYKLGVYYISPFVGRLDDMTTPGINLIHDLRSIKDAYGFETFILAASMRTILQVHDVALAGADIATLPVKLFEGLLEHPLTTKGMETFKHNWQKLGITQFP